MRVAVRPLAPYALSVMDARYQRRARRPGRAACASAAAAPVRGSRRRSRAAPAAAAGRQHRRPSPGRDARARPGASRPSRFGHSTISTRAHSRRRCAAARALLGEAVQPLGEPRGAAYFSMAAGVAAGTATCTVTASADGLLAQLRDGSAGRWGRSGDGRSSLEQRAGNITMVSMLALARARFRSRRRHGGIKAAAVTVFVTIPLAPKPPAIAARGWETRAGCDGLPTVPGPEKRHTRLFTPVSVSIVYFGTPCSSSLSPRRPQC